MSNLLHAPNRKVHGKTDKILCWIAIIFIIILYTPEAIMDANSLSFYSNNEAAITGITYDLVCIAMAIAVIVYNYYVMLYISGLIVTFTTAWRMFATYNLLLLNRSNEQYHPSPTGWPQGIVEAIGQLELLFWSIRAIIILIPIVIILIRELIRYIIQSTSEQKSA